MNLQDLKFRKKTPQLSDFLHRY